jgi:signal recognition particle subunit SEC65
MTKLFNHELYYNNLGKAYPLKLTLNLQCAQTKDHQYPRQTTKTIAIYPLCTKNDKNTPIKNFEKIMRKKK